VGVSTSWDVVYPHLCGGKYVQSRVITFALAAAGALFAADQVVAAGPDVTVTNTPLPVTVTNPPDGTPVAFTFNLCQSHAGCSPTQWTVPAQQSLVVEYVSALCSGATSGASQLPPLSVTIVTGGLNNSHFFTFPSQIPTGIYFVEFGNKVKLYADAGSQVVGSPSVDGFFADCQMVFSGRLLPVTQ